VDFSQLLDESLLFSLSSSSSAPYGVDYGENANTNLAVESLYGGFDSSHAVVLSNNEQPFEYNSNYNNTSYQSNSLSNNKDTTSISINRIDAQINIDLNDVLAKSQLSLERLNSCVSRMSLDEDAGLSIEDERDLLMLLMLDEQSTF
jgi:hypothetical protein